MHKRLHATCLLQVGAAIDESEMQDLFHASDIEGTGQIDYEQFIAAMLDSNRVARRKEAVSTGIGPGLPTIYVPYRNGLKQRYD